MNSWCLNLIVAVVFLQSTWVVGEEDFSQFEQQFKQLSEALSGGGAGGDSNGTVSFDQVPNDDTAAEHPLDQPAADQPAFEPTRPPKPEEASTFPPLARNGTEAAKETTVAPTKATTPKGDGGADYSGANLALVLGVACVLHLLY